MRLALPIAAMAAFSLGVSNPISPAEAAHLGSSGGIVFNRVNRSGILNIWTMSSDGRDLRRLTFGDHEAEFPSWSKDGKRIAFCGQPATGAHLHIYVMDADGTDVRRVTNQPHDDCGPAWSPDGRTIAFSRSINASHSAIFLIDSDGTHERRLTRGSSASWSPGGRWIAFSSNRQGPTSIYRIQADGTHLKRLTTPPPSSADDEPDWSPRAQWVVFTRGTGNFFGAPLDLYVMRADGSRLRRLTVETSAQDFAPVWSPDGRRILFSRAEGAENHIYIIGAEGTGLRNLTPGFDAWYPDWWGPPGKPVPGGTAP